MKKLFYILTLSIMLLTMTLFVGAENEITYKVGDIIYFGSYPQTEVKDENLLSELNVLAPEWENWTSYGYYSNVDGVPTQGDWMRYTDITYSGSNYRGVKFTQYRTKREHPFDSNAYQNENGYITDTVYWFKFEPIAWRVLDPNTGFVMCKTIIDSQPYCATVYNIVKTQVPVLDYYNDSSGENFASDYETSSMRHWLNQEFFNVAFTDGEKEKIRTTTLNNDAFVKTDLIGQMGSFLNSNVTNDKVFLLSYNEVRNSDFGFSPDESDNDIVCKGKGSDYAKSQGLGVRALNDDNNSNSEWFLRSPGTAACFCCSVGFDGSPTSAQGVDDASVGVRPALKLNNLSDIEQPVHAHTYTPTVTQEPTCWREGTTTYTCSCGDSYTEAIEKKEHEYRPWETKVKPKCTQPGMEWSYCLICDNDFEREIPATGHDIIEYVMRATTDEHAAYGGDGAYMTACDVCNEVFKQEFFARPAEYELSTSVYTYNGKVRKPTVTVKDADGKILVVGQDYDVIYPDGMKLPGKYEVTVLFKGNYLGEKRLTFTIKPKATIGLKAKTQDTKNITLSWSKTTGATGYEVYKYNSQTKKYVKIKTTTSTSYKVTSLNAGTTYKFKVRAYKKADDSTKIWGSYSSVFSTATKTTKPTLKSVTLSSGKVKLTWNNVSGESGYEIYYSTSKNGTYKKMSGVAANKISYTTSKLTAGKTYYFKVRTYKTVGDNKVYSAFSNVKSVKIPVVYYITKTGEKYHVDGCRSLSRSKIQISYSNAVARGYKPCNACIL